MKAFPHNKYVKFGLLHVQLMLIKHDIMDELSYADQDKMIDLEGDIDRAYEDLTERLHWKSLRGAL